MKEKILTRHILEGLIHNLNNPLNLILGYSQILRKAQPDNAEIAKIYQAGIRMDEVLKELYNRISERSFELIQEI
ncbi:MAG: histidine kinase dimerization/phospho-acceptor domain-containing protein, partial [Candidatus Cloacimonadaceae bacterium]|nr:histidine kinase dimerization/phospho-acceptor domain-containing protein [Candidatus Cloacimonadaceae bacterium]